jgi:hypothetical protein
MARHHWCNARRQLAVDVSSEGQVDMTAGCVTGWASWGRRQKGRGSIEAGVSGRCQHEDDSPHPAKRRASPLAAWPDTAQHSARTARRPLVGSPSPAQLAQPRPSTWPTLSAPRACRDETPRHLSPRTLVPGLPAMTSPQRPPPRAATFPFGRACMESPAVRHNCTASLQLTIATHDTRSNRSQTSGIRFGVPRASTLLAARLP